MTKTSHWIRVWWIGRVEQSTHVSKRSFLKKFSVQRGTPREADTASDLCDEYSACQARTERPVLAGQF